VSDAFKFFSTYTGPKELESDFEVVEMVLLLLEASKSLVFLLYWSFAKIHGPNIVFIEGLMKIHEDLCEDLDRTAVSDVMDRTAVSDVMDSIKRKVKEENLTESMSFSLSFGTMALMLVIAPEPTIMKKNRNPG
jgi:exocyst complex component 3